MKLKDFLELLRTSGVLRTWTLLAHTLRLRRYTRACLTMECLTALEKCSLNRPLLSKHGLDVTQDSGIDEQTLRTVCEYLYEIRLLTQISPNVYRARSRREFTRLLRVMYGFYAYHEPVHALDKLLRREWRYGGQVSRDDRYDALASADLTHFSYPFAAELLDGLRPRTIVDLGSGAGEYLLYLRPRHPEAQLWGVDLSAAAVHEGRARGAEAQRIRLVVGDMTQLALLDFGPQGADVFSMMFVLHEYGDVEVLGILEGIRKGHPGARVLLTELISVPSTELRRQGRGAFSELKFVHQLSLQQLRTPGKWCELFERAGFRTAAERTHALTHHIALLFEPGA